MVREVKKANRWWGTEIWRPVAAVAGLVAGCLLLAIPSPALAQNDPVGVSLKIEGCRNPSVDDLEAAGFICNDSDYTTGNLGKTWNELDLVPHRVTVQAGNSAPEDQTYRIAIVADHWEAGVYGYDVLSEPVLNPVLSSEGGVCEIDTAPGPALVKEPGFGGTERSLYRFVDVTQPRGSTCVFDYYERLAVGSHEFPGASLHSNLANKDLNTGGIGNKDVSIPVNEILPQELDKTMKGVKDTNHTWLLHKDARPATIEFGDTCDDGALLQKPVAITVHWVKEEVTPGVVNLFTTITGTNYAARSIKVNVCDQIYAGEVPLGEEVCVEVIIPKNTTMELLSHSTTASADLGGFRDVATASYIDEVTGVEVPGQTQAEAAAGELEIGETLNDTATVSDREWIEGPGLSFSVESIDGAAGTFRDGYALGTVTSGEVIWDSGTLTENGSVTFNKIVYFDGPGSTSGRLADEATLTSANGNVENAGEEVLISADATVDLTVVKEIPDYLQGDETVSFSFNVSDGLGYDSTFSLDFAAGETSKTHTIEGLAPGTYTVTELPAANWAPQAPQTVDLNMPYCAGEVTFVNSVPIGSAQATKTTIPAGEHEGWEMALTKPDGSIVYRSTNADGVADFGALDLEGTYSIAETGAEGWEQTGQSGDCTFTVDYPASAGDSFTCSFENTKLGKITVYKETIPADAPDSFDFGALFDQEVSFQLQDDGVGYASNPLLPSDNYAVWENLPEGSEWEEYSAICSDSFGTEMSPAKISLDAGDEVTCVFTNRKKGRILVRKLASPSDTGASFDFNLQPDNVNFSLTHYDAALGNEFDSGLVSPGDYSVAEVNLPDGWDEGPASCQDSGGNPLQPGGFTLAAGETVICEFENIQRGQIKVTKVIDAGDASKIFSFTASWGDFELGHNQTETFELTPNQSYSVLENLPDGWEMVSGTCDGSSNTTDLALAPGQVIECVFHNQQKGKIKVVKETDPVVSDASFGFGSNFMGAFTLTGHGDSETSGWLSIDGSYAVSENPLPAGGEWKFVSASCDRGTPGNVVVEAGQTTTCTFHNKKLAHIIVEKQTDPDGASALFPFTGPQGSFSLADNGTQDIGPLDPDAGPFAVSEGAVDGWRPMGYSCEGQDKDNIVLQPGQTLRCVFYNQQLAQLYVSKQTLPASGQAFDFEIIGESGGTFQLANGETFPPAAPVYSIPGPYSVTETVPVGWDLDSATCQDALGTPLDPAGFTLAPGAIVSCLFKNIERGGVTVIKTFAGGIDPTKSVVFTVTGREVNETENTLGDPDGVLEFDGALLIPGEIYTVCELDVAAGWSSTWTLDGFPIEPYNVNSGDNPPANLGNFCYDFSVPPGAEAVFAVNNIPPPSDGGQRTIGYWKNWSTCSGGNQVETAARNGGPAEGYWLLDNLLPRTLGSLLVDSCELGVSILNKSDFSNGRKRASDAAYALAAQLLAAELNFAAGAGTCAAAQDAATRGNTLLAGLEFDATGTYLKPKSRSVDRVLANELAGILDTYNNGLLCE